MRYGYLKNNIPPKINISPAAMIPNKYIWYQIILYISFCLKYKGTLIQSVKLSMLHQVPAGGMIQLVQCVQIIISTLADNYDKTTPFKFVKLDIKYDFWRLVFSNTDSWSFLYMLP